MSISRRAFVASALLAPVLVKLSTVSVLAQDGTAVEQVVPIQRFTVGDAVVTSISDGYLAIDPALLSNVTAEEVAALLADENVEGPPVTTGINAFVVRTGESTVLIDAGGAGAFPEMGRLVSYLEAAGIAPADIGTVLLTHMHPDHIGALVTDGAATFPEAELVVHATERDFWASAENREAAPDEFKPFFDLASQALDVYGDKVRTFAGEEVVVPGIRSRELFGHTPGHCGYLIGEGEDGLLVWGDIVHVGPIQFARPSVGIAFDAQPDVAIATREALLAEVAESGQRIAGMHISFPGIGHVKASGEGYDFEPAGWQYDLG